MYDNIYLSFRFIFDILFSIYKGYKKELAALHDKAVINCSRYGRVPVFSIKAKRKN